MCPRNPTWHTHPVTNPYDPRNPHGRQPGAPGAYDPTAQWPVGGVPPNQGRPPQHQNPQHQNPQHQNPPHHTQQFPGVNPYGAYGPPNQPPSGPGWPPSGPAWAVAPQGGPPKKSGSTALIVGGIAIATVVVIVIAVVAGILMNRSDDDNSTHAAAAVSSSRASMTTSPDTTTTTTTTPTTTTTTTTPVPVNYYGAIAISRDTGHWGYAVDAASQRQANIAALKYCVVSTCATVVEFRNACGALAQSQENSYWGWGWAPTRQGAISTAISYVKGGSPKVLVSTCTRNVQG